MSTSTNSTVAVPDTLDVFSHIPVGVTLGAWLLGGVAVTLFLNGILVQQMYQYFREYPRDRKLLKVWVVAVVIIETVVSALALHIAYFYLVEKYWDPTYFFLQESVWSLNVLPIPGTTAALLSQTFFVRRVWLFAPKFRAVVLIAFILNIGNVAFFTGLSVKLFQAANFSDGLRFSWLATVGSSIQLTGDIILTFTLIYVLRKSRTGLNKTDSMLEILIVYVSSTGSLNCIVHILTVAFSIARPADFIYPALSCILTKLYANTFLVALNTRKFLNTNLVANETMDLRTLSAIRIRNRPAMQASHETSTPTAIELKVVTEVTTDSEVSDHVQSKGECEHMHNMV